MKAFIYYLSIYKVAYLEAADLCIYGCRNISQTQSAKQETLELWHLFAGGGYEKTWLQQNLS